MPDNFLSLITCLIQHHNSKQIVWVCLNRWCIKNQRKACEICITDIHLDHQWECFHTQHLVLILENNRKRIVKLLNKITEMPITEEFRDNLKSLKQEIENAIFFIEEREETNLAEIIKLSLRCHNEQICKEITHLLYEEEHQNNMSKQLRIHITNILDSIFDEDDNDYLMSNYIQIGDTLNLLLLCINITQSNNIQLALQYYDRALSLSERGDDRFRILSFKYDLLYRKFLIKLMFATPIERIITFVIIKCKKLEEASLMLTKMNEIGYNQNPIRQIVYDKIKRFFETVKQQPQFNEVLVLLAQRAKQVQNPKLLKGKENQIIIQQ